MLMNCTGLTIRFAAWRIVASLRQILPCMLLAEMSRCHRLIGAWARVANVSRGGHAAPLAFRRLPRLPVRLVGHPVLPRLSRPHSAASPGRILSPKKGILSATYARHASGCHRSCLVGRGTCRVARFCGNSVKLTRYRPGTRSGHRLPARPLIGENPVCTLTHKPERLIVHSPRTDAGWEQ
jgi:hypothetical protein